MFRITVEEKWAWPDFPLMMCCEKFLEHPELAVLPFMTITKPCVILTSSPLALKFLWARRPATADTTIKWSIPQNPERW